MKRWPSWAPWALIALAVVAIALLADRPDSGRPFDPNSTAPLGTRALVMLLEQFDAEVSIGADPTQDADVAIVFDDTLGERQRERLLRWVQRDGGVLVVTDPGSDLLPGLAAGAGPFDAPSGDPLRLDCELPSVRDARRIKVPDPAMFRVGEDDVACYRDGDGAYLVARAEGDGTIVGIGGGAPFVNDFLGDADNAALAVGLLAPRHGGAVTILEPDAPGSGDEGLLDLIPRPVSAGIWQLVIAFVFVALWRARRLGKPVAEPQPVQIPGSELVVAVGNLLQQAGRRDAAADMLRRQLRRELGDRYGLPADASPERFANALAGSGVPADRVLQVLTPRPLADDRDFAAFAASVESLRREVTHV